MLQFDNNCCFQVISPKHKITLLHPPTPSYTAQSVLLMSEMALYDSVVEQRLAYANSGRMNITVYFLIYRHSLLS